MRGTRTNAINFLNYMMGYTPGQNGPARGGTRGKGFWNGVGTMTDQAQGLGPWSPPSGADARNRITDYFGPLGVAQTDLQRQSLGGLSDFLGPSGSLGKAQEALNAIMTGGQGAKVMDALQPRFQQNLASANQQGARFSSGNEILRSRALDDYNLLAAQAGQQDIQNRLQASGMMDMLGNVYGNAYGIGERQAAQGDIGTQRMLQILMQLMGTQQSAGFGLPVQGNPSGPNFATRLGSSSDDITKLIEALSMMGGIG
jgi:hypothetical protein